MTVSDAADKWNSKGVNFANLGKHDEAIKCYDKAIKIDPKYVWAWRNKGLALHNLGKYDEAIKLYNKAVEIDPNYVDVWNDKGNSLFSLRKYDEAIEIYDKGIEIDPKYALNWSNKASALRNLKKYEESVECSDKAIKLNPNEPYPWITKGYSILLIGKYSEAERYFNEALNLDPKNTDALNGLGVIYSDYTYEYDKALQISFKVLKINPNFEAKTNIAEDLIKIGNFEEGRKYALQALNETQDTLYQSILRFLILSSYLLDGKDKGAKEFANLIDYYINLKEEFKIEQGQWMARGLVNVISKSKSSKQTKFLLLTIIDLLQGNVNRNKLSFFNTL